MLDGTSGMCFFFEILCLGKKRYTLIWLFVLQQWYKRRKLEANCYVGEKYNDPVTHEDVCECTAADYEWYVVLLRPCLSLLLFSLTFVEPRSDFNFIRQDDNCVAVGPEPVPAGVCNSDDPDQMYQGSSGWRKVPGNTCEGGVKKDEKVSKKCSMGGFLCSCSVLWTLIWLWLAQPPEGNVIHQTVGFQCFSSCPSD